MMNQSQTIDLKMMKEAAAGRWLDILVAAGIPAERLDGKGHPCPKCGGSDRFAAHKDVDQRGAVICRGCLPKDGGDGLATIRWFRECDFPAALRFVSEHLNIMPGSNGQPQERRRIVAEYGYQDACGTLAYQAVRYDPKDFRQRRPKPGGGWLWNMQGVTPLPYRLPELLAADPAKPVVIVEGEKDADALAALGFVTTTNHGGAGKWTAAHAKHLNGRHVVIIPDNDEPGEDHARKVAESLQGVAISIRIVRLPDLPSKGDASDWLATGGTAEALSHLMDETPQWAPAAQQQVSRMNSSSWLPIDSLDKDRLPDFPTMVLPKTLREWVMAESLATQTPADLAGLLALAVCASCVAGRVDIEPHTGWIEPVNLFVAILLPPGNRKSAVFSEATSELRAVERDLIARAQVDVARELSERRQAQKQLDRWEKLAAEKGDAKCAEDAKNMAERLAAWPEPALPRLIVDDVTGEKLAILLAEQQGRLASLSAEGGVFDVMAGRYSKSGVADFDVYLKAHAGDELRTDRVSRKPVYIARPTLTCGYAIQPQVINGIARDPAFRGRGLLARFLYAAPPSWIGSRQVRPRPLATRTADAYAAVVRKLATMPPEGTLWLCQDADREFELWQCEIEKMLQDGGELEALRDWGSKLAGATARIAAVLHCVKYLSVAGMTEVELDTVQGAIEIARYLIPHAEAVLTLMQVDGGTPVDDARYVLRWIRRHQHIEFTRRDAHQDGKRRFLKVEDIDPALAELTRRGYIRPKPSNGNGTGRPPSLIYEVNPAIFDSENDETRPQNPQNSSADQQQGVFEDSEDAIADFKNAQQDYEQEDEWGQI